MRGLVQSFSLAFSLSLLGGCSPSQPAAQTPAETVLRAPPTAKIEQAPSEPLLSTDEAREAALSFEEGWSDVRYDETDRVAFLSEHDLNETQIYKLLEAAARPCLQRQDREAAECERLSEFDSGLAAPIETLIEIAAEVASIDPTSTETLRLLVRLDSRGLWRANMGIERVLERRMLAAQGECLPPTQGELDAAKGELGGFMIRDVGGALRNPTVDEMNDLASALAIFKSSGHEVGVFAENETAPALPAEHEDHVIRGTLAERMDQSLLDGELEEHAKTARAYLESLGHPAPLRVNEESGMRWGGRSLSYVMRDWALSAEILGDYETAEALYRRANPGGGSCGTSTASIRNDQFQGVIRTGEQHAGCRRVAVERLYSPGNDDAYGPEVLDAAGISVDRVYAGALLTMGSARDVESRIRALPGFADSNRADAIPYLLELSEGAETSIRIRALDALGQLVTNHGVDPCFRGSRMHRVTRGKRLIQSLMTTCAEALGRSDLDALAKRVAKLASDSDPDVRSAVAELLGNIASPSSRTVLEILAQDSFAPGGTTCSTGDDGIQHCRPTMPVRDEAKDALERISRAIENRTEQLARAQTES